MRGYVLIPVVLVAIVAAIFLAFMAGQTVTSVLDAFESVARMVRQ